MTLKGSWRITEMDPWHRDDINLVRSAFIEFRGTRNGRLGFVAVEGQLDCRHGSQAGRPFVEFTWDGWDDRDQVGGRGWGALEEDGSLRGHIFFHLGDNSGFRARAMSHVARNEPLGHADLEA